MATFTLPRRGLDLSPWNIGVWVGQAALAAVMAVNGVLRMFLNLEALRSHLPWVNPVNEWWLRCTGFALICGAVALVLPPLLGLSLKLVPATAMFMALVMIVTAAQHVMHAKPALFAMDVTMIALCVFVTWGRTRKVPY